METGSGRAEAVGRCVGGHSAVISRVVRAETGALVVEPLDEAEECLNGDHLDKRIVFEVNRDHDAPRSCAHSAVISVTAARAEDSSTMVLLVA